MKIYSKKEIWLIVLIILVAALGIYFFPYLPERVPTHWNIEGEVDGWMSKALAIWFFPALIIVFYLLLSFIPLIDPLRDNIEDFAGIYFWFKLIFILFLSGLYFLTLYTALGHQLDIRRLVLSGIAILFFTIGIFLPKIKKNYTIGIRLPWTLHSEVVWQKTHLFGGKLFKFLAIFLIAIAWLAERWSFYLMLGGLFLAVVILFVYAFKQWQIVQKDKS